MSFPFVSQDGTGLHKLSRAIFYDEGIYVFCTDERPKVSPCPTFLSETKNCNFCHVMCKKWGLSMEPYHHEHVLFLQSSQTPFLDAELEQMLVYQYPYSN